MSDLIKREDVLKQICEWVTNREFNYTNATHWLQKRIEAIPTIDAVSVVHGEWKHDGSVWTYRFNCTNCGYHLLGKQTNYCPNCGAKMKGAEDEGHDI